jgi:hypothetical protein
MKEGKRDAPNSKKILGLKRVAQFRTVFGRVVSFKSGGLSSAETSLSKSDVLNRTNIDRNATFQNGRSSAETSLSKSDVLNRTNIDRNATFQIGRSLFERRLFKTVGYRSERDFPNRTIVGRNASFASGRFSHFTR